MTWPRCEFVFPVTYQETIILIWQVSVKTHIPLTKNIERVLAITIVFLSRGI